MIREIIAADYDNLMKLYTQLHDNPIPKETAEIKEIWDRILHDRNHHIIVAEEDGKLVSSCVCVIIPNLTHKQRPYALLENVITDENYRRKGLATRCLDFAKEIAIAENCYKIMLLTGSKKESTLNFYRKAGFNSEDKTAFIQGFRCFSSSPSADGRPHKAFSVCHKLGKCLLPVLFKTRQNL